MVEDISYFWKNIKGNLIPKKDFIDLKNRIPIINLDAERSLFCLNNKIYFYNGISIITPGEYDILEYDIYFTQMIGKSSYDVIRKIFDIDFSNLKTKDRNELDGDETNELDDIIDGDETNELDDIIDEDETNELDDIINELAVGKYGNVDESNYWFIDIFPYIKCASFYCRDLSMPEENKKFFPNYGGRCIELLSDKKIIIDNIPVEKSDVSYEMERLKETNLEKVMTINGIPSNPFIKGRDPCQKDIIDSWLNIDK